MGRLLFLIVLVVTALGAFAGAAQGAPPRTRAVFTFSPLAPQTGQPVRFDGSGSDCLRPPCTYTWTDEPPGGGVYALGTGQTLDFTFQGAGTKYVNLSVRDARGNTARVEHDVIVSAAPLPPPPPTDTTPPTVRLTSPTAGSTVVGTINLGASASDNVAVDHVIFRVDGNSVGSDSTSPYSASYNTAQVANGSHNFSAQAVDRSGNVSAVSQASATVQNGTSSGGTVRHATTSNFASVWSAAQGGDTIYLASGNYGTFTGGVKSSLVTIRPEPGATPAMALSFSPAAYITLDGMTITGGTIADSRTHDITVRNSTFDRAQVVFRTGQLANANILFDHNVYSNFVKCSGCYEGRIELTERSETTPDGVTIQNSEFYGGNSDAIQNGGNGTRIIGNEFHDIRQTDSSAGVHADSIQLYGSKNTVIRDNYFHDVAVGIMAADGADHETIENNVMKVTGSPYAVDLESDNGSVIRHNTIWGGGTCDYSLQCGVLYLGNKSVDPVSTGTKITDNVYTRICVCDGSNPTNQTEDYNLIAAQTGAGAHDIRGMPTYLAGVSPVTLAGFALTATSPGHAAADDRTDIGADISP